MVPTEYYLILSAILFTIGVVGVLIRRNVLIIFMSVEMMLNAVNLTFVALARPLPGSERPDLRADGDGRRRGRGRRRPGDRHDGRAAQGHDEYRGCESVEGLTNDERRRTAASLRHWSFVFRLGWGVPMFDYAWLMLLFPALGTLILAFFGTRLGRRVVGWLAPGMVAAELRRGRVDVRDDAGPARRRAQPRDRAVVVDDDRHLPGRRRAAASTSSRSSWRWSSPASAS